MIDFGGCGFPAIVYLKEVSRRWCKRGSGEVEKPALQEIDLMKEVEDDKVLEVVRDSGDKKSWTSSFQLWSSDLNPSIKSTKQVMNVRSFCQLVYLNLENLNV